MKYTVLAARLTFLSQSRLCDWKFYLRYTPVYPPDVWYRYFIIWINIDDLIMIVCLKLGILRGHACIVTLFNKKPLFFTNQCIRWAMKGIFRLFFYEYSGIYHLPFCFVIHLWCFGTCRWEPRSGEGATVKSR